MLAITKKDVDAVRYQMESHIFRYNAGGKCSTFEERYAQFIGGKHVALTASGTSALTAALAAVGIGPGDEVIVPAHTYMATAVAVLQVGAIPVIVDIDSSIALDPAALDDAVGPRTRAVMPVHMWGTVCNMRKIMKVARKHKLLVVEDCCQAIGGAFEGKMVGTFGPASAYSFNYWKNITCGEGGAVHCANHQVHAKAICYSDCCGFFWTGRKINFDPFVAGSARKSDMEGAMLHTQLDQLPGLIKKLRSAKQRLIKATEKTGLVAPVNSLDWECGTMMLYFLPSTESAAKFANDIGAGLAIDTGRHSYHEWDPILQKRGHIHPDMDPFRMQKNKGCRMTYAKDMLPRSLDILGRLVMVGLSHDMRAADIKALSQKINAAAKEIV